MLFWVGVGKARAVDLHFVGGNLKRQGMEIELGSRITPNKKLLPFTLRPKLLHNRIHCFIINFVSISCFINFLQTFPSFSFPLSLFRNISRKMCFSFFFFGFRLRIAMNNEAIAMLCLSRSLSRSLSFKKLYFHQFSFFFFFYGTAAAAAGRF